MKKLMAVFLGLLLLGATGLGMAAEGQKTVQLTQGDSVVVKVTIPESVPDLFGPQYMYKLLECNMDVGHIHVVQHILEDSDLVILAVSVSEPNTSQWRIVALLIQPAGTEDQLFYEDITFLQNGTFSDTLTPVAEVRPYAELIALIQKHLGKINI